jgi:hypothetical protein
MKTTKIATIAKAATMAVVAGAIAIGSADVAQAATGTMYGDPTAAAKWWRLQNYGDCAIMATADAIGQVTGKEPSERAIIKKAQNTPSVVHSGSIYIKPTDVKSDNGTSPGDIPTLLAQYGVKSVQSNKDHASKTGIAAGIEGIEQALKGGHAVIVSVNAEMIWGQPITSKDKDGNPVSDHSLVVTGVDTAKNIVHLNDSGTEKGKDEQVSLELFLKAWDTSNERITVTT